VVNFAKLEPVMPMPNLLDVQLRSFEKLIEREEDPEGSGTSASIGCSGDLPRFRTSTRTSRSSTCPPISASPKYSVEECIERDMTFASPSRRFSA
jgi:DNA-directed RNA polymerase subunit beta